MMKEMRFWSSADLTGNQTSADMISLRNWFWSSADLTGNQTGEEGRSASVSFGAVPI